MFWSIALVAFYGLARLGELLPKSDQNISKVPTIQALRFEKQGGETFARIQLPRTKVHKITEHPTLIINSTKDGLCSIEALKAYMLIRTKPAYAPGEKIQTLT